MLKRTEHKDNLAGLCCSAALLVDSVKAHSQFPLAAVRLAGCQAKALKVVTGKQNVKRLSFLFPTAGKKKNASQSIPY